MGYKAVYGGFKEELMGRLMDQPVFKSLIEKVLKEEADCIYKKDKLIAKKHLSHLKSHLITFKRRG